MSANKRIADFLSRQDGAAAVEFALVGPVFLLLIAGIIDFGNAFWQYNQASKAVQLGARLAAVSAPVSSDLATMTGEDGTNKPGDPMPYFQRVCTGGTTGSCTGGTYNATAMNTIVYGRGNTSCPAAVGNFPPMCAIFPRVTPANVRVTYTQTGLGFVGRAGGPVPTIQVELVNVNYNFLILNGLLNFNPIPMNGIRATAVAEDMRGA
ncbi:MAG TPA: TadE/TadG family type IV pilus assembly protein [Microvirga sp.]|jgi:Flp pilus assembly protein TadG|nr:TadE/TadG family type IV pilus assembly protein [Microvirga sp.]